MTRKKKKGMLKPFIVGAAIFILLLVIIPYIFENANAVSRIDLENARNIIQQSENKIQELETSISEKQIQVINIKQRINQYQDQLDFKTKLANEDWLIIPELEPIKQDIQNLKTNQQKTENELEKLETRKTLAEQNHQKLLNQFTDMEFAYIQTNKPDIKKLGLHKVIGITLSDSCIALIQSNSNTNCPTYKDLIQLDSSLTEYSGKFYTDENEFFKRGKPPYPNSWRMYDHDSELRIIVDPPSGMVDRIKTIEIRPNFHTYLLQNDLTQKPEYELVTIKTKNIFTNKTINVNIKNQTQEYSRIIYHDRYIDSCKVAYINAEKWQLLLADTIHHIRSNCSNDSTSFQTKEVIPLNYTTHDISTSKDFQHKAWLDYVKTFCIFKFKACQT